MECFSFRLMFSPKLCSALELAYCFMSAVECRALASSHHCNDQVLDW